MAKQTLSYSVGATRIRKRPNSKYWFVLFKNEAGQWREKSLEVTNKVIAEQKARELSDLIEGGEYDTIETRRRGATFAEVVAEFKESYTGWGKATFVKNNGTLNALCAEFGNLSVAAISTRQIEAYLARRIDMDGITTATRNRYLATLKTLYKCAARWGYIARNPTEPVKIQKEEGKIPNALSPEEVEAVLALLPEISALAATVATVAADTGARRGEIQRIAWEDIDLEAETLTIPTSKNKEPRRMPLTPRLIALFARLRPEQPAGLVLRFDNVKRALTTAGRRLGIGHIHFHQFRHSYATHLLDAGVPLERVQYLLGHSSIEITQRYDHPRPARYRDAVAALAELREKAAEKIK